MQAAAVGLARDNLGERDIGEARGAHPAVRLGLNKNKLCVNMSEIVGDTKVNDRVCARLISPYWKTENFGIYSKRVYLMTNALQGDAH